MEYGFDYANLAGDPLTPRHTPNVMAGDAP